MITEEQQPVVELLGSPATHGGAPVERIETHSAIVFLAGARAYKLKRAVRFDYLDFSTADRRRAMCEAEVRLNRRTAPTLYRGVVAVTRERDGSLALSGAGRPVEWLVEMNRFDQDLLFDRLAAAGRLDLELMPTLAAAIAALHATAEQRSDHGGRPGMSWVVDGNAAGFAEYGAGCLDAAAAARVTEAARRAIDRSAVLLDRRRDAGLVRQCHGDLHLRNIVLHDGRPTLFDGIEFNDQIACTDVLYDLAFLLMDLWRRRLPRHANAVWNGYLIESADLSGLSLMPLFLSCRAAVRAKTSATAAQLQGDGSSRDALRETARQYLSLAERLLQPPAASLIAIGGLSGSGKSTLALGLAPLVGAVPGALVLRSDEIRKRLLGASPLERLGPEGYSPQVSEGVYHTLADRAAAIVAGGQSAIVDAVYARPADRDAVERAAAAAAVPFAGFWLEAQEPTLIARVERRGPDPSDADAGVVRLQRVQQTGTIGWQRLDASASTDAVLQSALAVIKERMPGALNPHI